ncbi:AmmeMemoRadiSam system radical SAM enzyme [Acetonema longum]|uniref:Radical SAM domain protein n=1 Tax=Acetonema longum DSM 6540 TaxID=1009370 RepID=F7NF55_9FIRM|nr:AmmeMemoRadiSam system radical SAM enzyme [Acetonema longum]EGO65310.1 Radical SAM domain protein [Acetonema longum DSM 6540]
MSSPVPDRSRSERFCRVRRNRDGQLVAENYGACTFCAMDPIEKKPLYHFYPGSRIFSIGSWGCNFTCHFCQNWTIAQQQAPSTFLSPEAVVDAALRYQPENIGIAYTYSEPGVWYEYLLDTARLARLRGLKNVMVTNGFIEQPPLIELLPNLDAMNIDVKGFSEGFYRQMCGGSLVDVKRTVEKAAASCHTEITTLVIAGHNDDPSEIRELARWLAAINPDIPLHLSRYFPAYKMDQPPTDIRILQNAGEIAREHLRYVYLGNVGGYESHTCCPECGQIVLDRFRRRSLLQQGKMCPHCGTAIAITGEVLFV